MQQVADITFIIGPPGPPDLKGQLEQWSKESGKSTNELWVQFVHKSFEDLIKLDPGQTTSELDKLVSKAANAPVHIRDPFLTNAFMRGGLQPAIILHVAKISSPSGAPPKIDWGDMQIRELIGSVFGLIFKADWVRSLVTYS